MTKVKKWPDRALVGYVTAYGSHTPPNVTNEMIDQAIYHNYNVFVYAFGYINESNEVSIPSGITEQDLHAQIDKIHQHNGLALISFGGQNNTFTPNSDPRSAALNTIEYCKKFNFDGIDLDLEDVQVTSRYVLTYIKEIRDIDSEIFITAAPQIHGGYGGPASFEPNNIFTKQFLESARLSAVLVQEYNQRGGAVFDGLQDTDIGFISASYGPLTDLVPECTKIIVGEPATKEAAPAGGLFFPKDIVMDIENGGRVLKSSQYGGIMVWAINYDSEQNWSFAKGVQPVVKQADKSDLVLSEA